MSRILAIFVMWVDNEHASFSQLFTKLHLINHKLVNKGVKA